MAVPVPRRVAYPFFNIIQQNFHWLDGNWQALYKYLVNDIDPKVNGINDNLEIFAKQISTLWNEVFTNINNDIWRLDRDIDTLWDRKIPDYGNELAGMNSDIDRLWDEVFNYLSPLLDNLNDDFNRHHNGFVAWVKPYLLDARSDIRNLNQIVVPQLSGRINQLEFTVNNIDIPNIDALRDDIAKLDVMQRTLSRSIYNLKNITLTAMQGEIDALANVAGKDWTNEINAIRQKDNSLWAEVFTGVPNDISNLQNQIDAIALPSLKPLHDRMDGMETEIDIVTHAVNNTIPAQFSSLTREIVDLKLIIDDDILPFIDGYIEPPEVDLDPVYAALVAGLEGVQIAFDEKLKQGMAGVKRGYQAADKTLRSDLVRFSMGLFTNLDLKRQQQDDIIADIKGDIVAQVDGLRAEIADIEGGEFDTALIPLELLNQFLHDRYGVRSGLKKHWQLFFTQIAGG